MSILQMPLPGEIVTAEDGTRLKRGPVVPLYQVDGCKGCFFEDVKEAGIANNIAKGISGGHECRNLADCRVMEERKAYIFVPEYDWEKLEL